MLFGHGLGLFDDSFEGLTVFRKYGFFFLGASLKLSSTGTLITPLAGKIGPG